MRRAQLSLSLVEAGVGVLLLLGVTAGLFLVPTGGGAGAGQLDAYAADAGVLLTTAGDGPRLGAALRSERAFAANRSALRERIEGLLPATVLYRVETPRGDLGYPVPAGRPVGVARVPTRHGTVTIRVWYP